MEGEKDYTCNGIRRDMARHLASCTYFKDIQTKTTIKVYLRGFNKTEKRGRDEGREAGLSGYPSSVTCILVVILVASPVPALSLRRDGIETNSCSNHSYCKGEGKTCGVEVPE